MLAMTLAGAACSRELPSQWPTSSPASSGAAQLPPAPVTLAVDEDPPLPGEDAEGWFGLERPAANGGEHHHSHHHGHGNPTSEGGGHGH